MSGSFLGVHSVPPSSDFASSSDPALDMGDDFVIECLILVKDFERDFTAWTEEIGFLMRGEARTAAGLLRDPPGFNLFLFEFEIGLNSTSSSLFLLVLWEINQFS